ncbi:unnamed protein product [Larinioides sclopetarius]|uniref:Carboxylic ester hydrolase n=1 Tax=Larinioides sclopetarius TaxID=280406 RepID=A0AAV2B6R4_9ARAC
MKIFTNFWWLVILLLCTLRVLGQGDDPRVTTSLGELVGSFVQVNDIEKDTQIQVKQFLGVPFANPPLEDLRFLKPEAIEAWSEPIECKIRPKACVQYTEAPYPWRMNPDDPNISEDCLYLNIWVPKDASPQNKKSVFFWIHGGGFFMGSIRQEIYEGQVMAALGDVIVVTTNYRLGSLGFWSNGRNTAPGNVGVWDVITALKWVHTHIESFGGEKDNITIAGESAGSAIVSLLPITEHAKGYFRRLLMQSGSVMWKLMDDEKAAFKRSFAVAKRLGCANDSFTLEDHPDEIETCMRGIDALTIIKAEESLNPGASSSFFPGYGDELFPRNPREVLLEGNFQFQELFIGNSGIEGAFKITTSNPGTFGFFGEKQKYDLFTKERVEEILKKSFSTFEDKECLVKHYLGKETPYTNEFAIAKALGDYGITCPTVYFAALSAQSGVKVYYYDFQHKPTKSQWADWMGPTHFDEVEFVFGGPIKKPQDDWPVYGENFETVSYISGNVTHIKSGLHLFSCMFWRPYFDPDGRIKLPEN